MHRRPHSRVWEHAQTAAAVRDHRARRYGEVPSFGKPAATNARISAFVISLPSTTSQIDLCRMPKGPNWLHAIPTPLRFGMLPAPTSRATGSCFGRLRAAHRPTTPSSSTPWQRSASRKLSRCLLRRALASQVDLCQAVEALLPGQTRACQDATGESIP